MFKWLYKRIEGYSPAYNRNQLISIVAIIIFMLVNLIAHLSFALFFDFINVSEMKAFNVESVIFFVLLLYLTLYKYRFILACYLFIIQVSIYTAYASYMFGYERSSVLILPVIIFAIYHMVPLKKTHLNRMGMIVAIAFVVVLYVKENLISPYGDVLDNILYVHIFFAVGACLFIINIETIAKVFVNKYSETEDNFISKEAYQDFLTGLWNRRFMEIEFEKMKNTENAVLILADIDYFKNINDTYGHNTGDYVLKELSTIFRSNLREVDILCRWGGEEFLFYVKNAREYKVVERVEKIRKQIENANFTFGENTFKLTVSCGVAAIDPTITVLENIEKADKALYYSKETGRNKITTFDEIPKND